MPRIHKTLVATALLLAGMGVLSIWTQYPPTDLQGRSITQSIFVKHVVFLAAALPLMILVVLPPYTVYRHLSYVLYGGGLATLALLLVKAQRTRGTAGWFSLGPINVQPAEFFKIALVLTLARVLMYGRDVRTWRGLILPIALVGVPAALVLKQPDLGTTLLFVPTLFVMLFVAGARKRHLALMAAVLLAAAPVAYFKLQPYQRARLTAFLDDGGYQVKQAVKAVSAGRVLGRGLGESATNLPFYVPDRHTDFPYSIVAEELGFVGSSFVLLLYAAFFVLSIGIARQSREPFGRLVVTGMVTWMATQTFINLGMTLGVAPVTGLTLPFISYGGSSLLTCALATGIILNVGARWQPSFASRDMAVDAMEISGFTQQAVRQTVLGPR